MFKEELTLGDFVCPITICQPETDLGSLLKIFQHSNCDLIAIFIKEKGFKIISSSALLAQLGKLLQGQGFASISHSQQRINQENCFSLKILDFDHLLEFANIYLTNVGLLEFLQNSDHVGAKNSFATSLIVDEFGRLKGRLDQPKIFRYLASVVNNIPDIPEQTVRPIHKLSEFVRSFVDSIESPVQIETATGQSVYSNKSWRELVTSSGQENVLPNAAIANWWIGQQFPFVNRRETTANLYQASESSSSCCNIISSTGAKQINGLEIFQTKPLPPWFSDHCAASNFFPLNTSTDTISETLPFSHLDIQIEQSQNWSQIKIPITLISNRAQITANSDNSLYWLILATKTNNNSSANHLSIGNLATSEKIVTELIGTISHELKSPLTGIIGLSSLLKDQQLGQLNQRQTLYTQLINDSGFKLMEIVNDLLELQGIVDSNIVASIECFNLSSLCRHVYDKAFQKFKANKISQSDTPLFEVQLKLEIEPELEIITTNKRNLSVILSHLFLEIFQLVDFPTNTLTVKITQEGEEISLKISNSISSPLLGSSFSASILSKPSSSSGWHLTLAKYLVQGIKGSIQSHLVQDNCQLTLVFPSNNKVLSSTSSGKAKKPGKHLLKDEKSQQPNNITILCLYPELDALRATQDTPSSLDFNLKNWAEKDWSNISENPLAYQYRIIEADGLEQAHTLARIWKLDVIIIDGHQINKPKEYLQSLQQSNYLAALPLITLDTRTTEAANLIEGLNIYPCLLPDECRSVNDLMQVIRIATGLEK